jgi:hypothetical protein
MRIFWYGVFVLFGTVFTIGNAAALSPYPAGSTGIDVSWPQQNCSILENSKQTASFAIIGINHGLDFTGNTCLQQETSAFNDYAIYLNTGYPGQTYGLKYKSSPNHCKNTDYQCLAFNYGFNDVLYSLKFADLHNAHTTQWWLDVETDNSWTNNPLINEASLLGMVSALKQSTLLPNIGFYASPVQWSQITGNWQNNSPAWAATGSTDRASALNACHEVSFTGGQTILTQYTLKLDQDYACGSAVTD